MAPDHMVGDSFRLGYRAQDHWGTSMAAAFFCGELGGGLFLVSMFLENAAGLVLGLAIVGLGKPVFHLTHMGVPGKSWRAILRPDRSWTSRGLMAIVVLMGAGTGHAINLIWGDVLPLGGVLQILAGGAAVVVMTYQGFAMSQSTAIALWHTAMMPLLSLLYAVTGGLALVLLLPPAGVPAGVAPWLVPVLQGLLTVDLLALFGFVYTAYTGSPGAAVSARLMIRTRFALWFLGVVVAAGLILPLLLLLAGGDGGAVPWAAAAAILAGFLAFRILVFKAGVFEPVMPAFGP